MTTAEMQQEALGRARGSLSISNYPAIFRGFVEKGIAEDDIRPRENIFTFNAWKALGRHVRKGQHGVKVHTWIPGTEDKTLADGEVVKRSTTYPKTTTVFHVSQTDATGKVAGNA